MIRAYTLFALACICGICAMLPDVSGDNALLVFALLCAAVLLAAAADHYYVRWMLKSRGGYFKERRRG